MRREGLSSTIHLRRPRAAVQVLCANVRHHAGAHLSLAARFPASYSNQFIDSDVASDPHSTANAVVSAEFADRLTAERIINNAGFDNIFLADKTFSPAKQVGRCHWMYKFDDISTWPKGEKTGGISAIANSHSRGGGSAGECALGSGIFDALCPAARARQVLSVRDSAAGNGGCVGGSGIGE